LEEGQVVVEVLFALRRMGGAGGGETTMAFISHSTVKTT
jgi:hypothetical protein